MVTQVDDGRLLMGGSIDIDDTSTQVNADAIEGLRRQLVAAFPELAGGPLHPRVVLLAASSPRRPARH